jgi:pyrroloquinoline-quinone synthase
MSNTQAALDPIIARWNLLNHPFYQAWSEGTLPAEALRRYAAEYGNFIALLADGWDRAGNPAHAAEEREHAELWADFTRALGAEVSPPATEGVQALLRAAADAFADADGVWGALYAFERQQPATADSKRKGLRAFYALPESAHRYFDVHANDPYEAEIICDHLDQQPPAALDRAAAACETLCRAMWDALSGFHADCAS